MNAICQIQKKWIAVDLTYNYIFFRDETYKLLNTLDVISAVDNNRSLYVNQVVSDTLVVKKNPGIKFSGKNTFSLILISTIIKKQTLLIFIQQGGKLKGIFYPYCII